MGMRLRMENLIHYVLFVSCNEHTKISNQCPSSHPRKLTCASMRVIVSMRLIQILETTKWCSLQVRMQCSRDVRVAHRMISNLRLSPLFSPYITCATTINPILQKPRSPKVSFKKAWEPVPIFPVISSSMFISSDHENHDYNGISLHTTPRHNKIRHITL